MWCTRDTQVLYSAKKIVWSKPTVTHTIIEQIKTAGQHGIMYSPRDSNKHCCKGSYKSCTRDIEELYVTVKALSKNMEEQKFAPVGS